LNTIYGMARRTDLKTANAVLTLSDILRHNIYESSEAYISMEKEISVIKQYIAFTQLRLHHKDTIKLNIHADVRQQKIAPLLLLPFIENAIKHGLDKYVEKSYVEITLALRENNLHFTCSNYSADVPLENKETGKGIGLKNVQRRLELCYPGRHHLKIDTSDDRYSVELQIQLI
jgi:two-component system LytT family sensor kinase